MLEEKVEEIVQDPKLLKRMLLQILPHVINDDKSMGSKNNDAEEESYRTKRSLFYEPVFKPHKQDSTQSKREQRK